MPIQNQLFWKKYRPTTINNIVILPRIKSLIDKGIQKDLLFYGHPGTGKSALIEILLKGKNFIKINASMQNGIDTLRDTITDFCDSMGSPFIKTDDKMKYVYLEEFDEVTPAFQNGFKAFIEYYSDRVRFIISMNDITNMIPALHSRFNPPVCFNPANDDEKAFLLKGYYKYLMSVVKHAKMDISDEVLHRMINTNFPDLRSAVQELQTIYITGNFNNDIVGANINIFDFMLNGENDFSENFYFVMDNWVNRPKELIDIMGRPLYNFLLKNRMDIIQNKGFDLLNLTKKYNAEFQTTTDPPLHVFSLICDIKNILNKQ